MTATMTPREQMYSDIIVGAVEGGTGYWAQVEQYQFDYDGEIVRSVGELIDGPRTTARLHVFEDTGVEGFPIGHTAQVTSSTVARAFGILRNAVPNEQGELHSPDGVRLYASQKWRQTMLGFYAAPEDADIDADDADMLVQLGVFGRVIFG